MHLKIENKRRPPSDKQFIPVRHPGWNHHLHTMSGLYSLNGRNSNGGWFRFQKAPVVWVNIFANPSSKALLNWQMRSSRWFKVTVWSPSWRSLSHWKGNLTIPKRWLWITRFTGSSQGMCIFITVGQSPWNIPHLVNTFWSTNIMRQKLGSASFLGMGLESETS